MTTRIRLRRMGSNKRPFFRVVVADQRSPRDGRFIENIGKYHPLDDPSVIEIDQDRALHWLRVGAQPSNQVRNLMNKIGIWDEFVKERPSAALETGKARPEKPKVSKKAKQKAEASAAEPEAPPAAEPETAPAADVETPTPAEPETAPAADVETPTPAEPAASAEVEPAAEPEASAEVEPAAVAEADAAEAIEAVDETPADETPADETPEGS
jgi:small subunit ribosomal protein S16